MKTRGRYPDTGESGESYDVEFQGTLSDKRERRRLDNNVSLHLSELPETVREQCGDEEILLNKLLSTSAKKKRNTPYGSPYHRTQSARNYRKDLDK